MVVLPNKTEELQIKKGEDYCTLVTCTPYGINTHRMLVRGTRIENIEEAKKINVITEAYQIDPFIVTPAVAAPMLGALLVFLMIKSSKEKKLNEAKAREKAKNNPQENTEENEPLKKQKKLRKKDKKKKKDK